VYQHIRVIQHGIELFKGNLLDQLLAPLSDVESLSEARVTPDLYTISLSHLFNACPSGIETEASRLFIFEHPAC